MSMVISFAMVALRLGFVDDFLIQWLEAWRNAFIVAYPSAILTGKLLQNMMSRIQFVD